MVRKGYKSVDEEVNSSSSSLDSLREQFKAESSKPVTRTVRVKFMAGCGCGPGSDTEVWLDREVPFSDSARDGDEVKSIQMGDQLV